MSWQWIGSPSKAGEYRHRALAETDILEVRDLAFEQEMEHARRQEGGHEHADDLAQSLDGCRESRGAAPWRPRRGFSRPGRGRHRSPTMTQADVRVAAPPERNAEAILAPLEPLPAALVPGRELARQCERLPVELHLDRARRGRAVRDD